MANLVFPAAEGLKASRRCNAKTFMVNCEASQGAMERWKGAELLHPVEIGIETAVSGCGIGPLGGIAIATRQLDENEIPEIAAVNCTCRGPERSCDTMVGSQTNVGGHLITFSSRELFSKLIPS